MPMQSIVTMPSYIGKIKSNGVIHMTMIHDTQTARNPLLLLVSGKHNLSLQSTAYFFRDSSILKSVCEFRLKEVESKVVDYLYIALSTFVTCKIQIQYWLWVEV